MTVALRAYLQLTLGELPAMQETLYSHLPLFPTTRFTFLKTSLFGTPIVFAADRQVPSDTSPQQWKTLQQRLETELGASVVPVLPHVHSYIRNRLVQLGVPFVVPGAQMFLPRQLVDLREKFGPAATPALKTKHLTPTAQLLVINQLVNPGSMAGRSIKDLAVDLGYSSPMLGHARNELQGRGLCRSVRHGKQVNLVFDLGGRQLWEKALPYLTSPVQKTFWSTWGNMRPFASPQAGMTALSQLTTISDDKLPTYAVRPAVVTSGIATGNLKELPCEDEASALVEVWSYDPRLLADAFGQVDPFSLWLSLRHSHDERVQQQLQTLLKFPA